MKAFFYIRKMKQILLLGWIAYSIFGLKAQEYVALPETSPMELEQKSSDYIQHSKKFISSIGTQYSGKLKKHLEGNFEDMHLEFSKEILDGNLLFNQTIEDFVQGVLDELRSQNPEVPEMAFFIAKDGSVNAYSMGDNYMLINLGLFYFLEDEASIASVISHEIGHQMLNHSVQTQINRFEKKNSNSYKDELEKLRKSKYNTQNKALNLLKSHLYDLSAKSRKNEYEADSLGYMIYKNTKYPKSAYLSALETMERYDTIQPKGLKVETYKLFFDLEEQAFQDEWLEMEDFSDYHYNYQSKIDEDSISSHPEIQERINRLKKLFPEIASDTIKLVKSETYNKVWEMAKYERIPNYYFNEQYGDGVYLALLNLQKEPESEFYKKWLGKNFMKIYEARKDYTLNRYLDRIDPENQSQSYQQFLSFMWNLRLEEIETIAKHYYQEE